MSFPVIAVCASNGVCREGVDQVGQQVWRVGKEFFEDEVVLGVEQGARSDRGRHRFKGRVGMCIGRLVVVALFAVTLSRFAACLLVAGFCR